MNINEYRLAAIRKLIDMARRSISSVLYRRGHSPPATYGEYGKGLHQ